jgi:Thioredoxin-like
MLIKAYNHLKEEYPSHARLEIGFISSDQSETEFVEYFASMPWMALPYGCESSKSMRFVIQRLPGLVILDSLSGSIVASTDQSRTEVGHACQRGDVAKQLAVATVLGRDPFLHLGSVLPGQIRI